MPENAPAYEPLPNRRPGRLVTFPGQGKSTWCETCKDFLAQGESCPHYEVSLLTISQFAAERGIAPPKGYFCDRHFSWLCQEGHGACQGVS